ncbi:type II secretion system GspH family protein [Clostridium tyrobutyricum]|nr:type II secretion system GspH family protein [Clostridium tyrobutyricum]MBV4448390.1 type II secretion system GspH family protein [Clostridium tyrobutyricum]
MRKRGFTYIEIMVALGVFMVLSIFIIRLNITSNRNMNMQIERQNMIMEAQKCIEEIKSDPIKYNNNNYKSKDGYYVSQFAKRTSTSKNISIFEITVKVKSVNHSGDPVLLSTQFLFQSNETED